MKKHIIFTVLHVLLVSIGDTTKQCKIPRASGTKSSPSRKAADVFLSLSPLSLAQNSVTRTGGKSNSIHITTKYDVFPKIFNKLQKISSELLFSNANDDDTSHENLKKLYNIAKNSLDKEPTQLFFRLMKKYDKDNEKPSERYYKRRDNFFDAVAKSKTYRIVFRALRDYSPELFKGEHTLRNYMDKAWTKGKPGDKPGGFEHTFFGEVRDDDRVRGMHYWLRIAHYLVDNKCEQPGLRLLRKDWPRTLATGNISKPQHSAFLGFVPEFDVLIYTAVHLIFGGGGHRITIDYKGSSIHLLILTSSYESQSPINSAFPVGTT